MIVYLAGPMTGHADFNSLAFLDAEAYATDRGWKTVSPRTTDPSHAGDCPPGERHTTAAGSHPYTCWVRASLRMMLDCDAILLLPGWETSRGARIERDVAEACGMAVLFVPVESPVN